jgi:hypothetical protein
MNIARHVPKPVARVQNNVAGWQWGNNKPHVYVPVKLFAAVGNIYRSINRQCTYDMCADQLQTIRMQR